MSNVIYLDTYILQQDMRIRMPKSILSNINAEKGKTLFDIYFDADNNAIGMGASDERLQGTGRGDCESGIDL